ncbi:MAG: RnfABCDGE type electron transport complex subunit G [Oscillospiraceae bacterium]|nr:RnfABCDGE type electron transport complex subunit G [Oscillospiraceae bacterium]
MKDYKYVLRLTLTLLLITAVVAGLLGLVNYLTEDKIDALTREKAEKAMQDVLPAAHYEPIAHSMDGVTEAYRADDKGYVVRVNENGFGGSIDMMVGVGADGKVCGVSIISHSETASLGANCVREDFRAQYLGADSALAVKKDGGTIDALTGATVTSRAVTRGVNLALEFVKEVG